MPAPFQEGVEMPELADGSEIQAADELRASFDVEDDSSDESDDDISQQTSRKRAQSLDSARRSLHIKKVVYLKQNMLSSEQERVVEAATNSLTQEQKSQVQRRQNRVKENNPPEPSTSLDKGKIIDPREWGNVDMPSEEISVAMQKALLEAYQRGHEQARQKSESKLERQDYPNESEDEKFEENFQIPVVARHKSIALSTQDLGTKRGNSKPAAQIVPDSSLGVALQKLARLNKDTENPNNSFDPSDSDYKSSSYSRSTRSSSCSRTRRRKRRHGSK